MDILQLRDVRYTYQTQYQKVEALKGITHGFDTGRVHAIVGRLWTATPPCSPAASSSGWPLPGL